MTFLMCCPDSSVGKESCLQCRNSQVGFNPGWIPGLGRSAGERIGCSLQYSLVSLVAQLVKNPPSGRPVFNLWVGKIPWRRERIPTPGFWPREFHGLYSPWGHKESDKTEWLSLSLSVRKEEKSRISASELSETCSINCNSGLKMLQNGGGGGKVEQEAIL